MTSYRRKNNDIIRQQPSIEEDNYCPSPPRLRRYNNIPTISIDQSIMDSKLIPTCLGNGKISVSIQLPDYTKDIEQSQLIKIIDRTKKYIIYDIFTTLKI